MSIYGTYLQEANEEKYYPGDKAYIKKNESKIKRFIDKSLKDFFYKEKDNKKSNPDYDWRSVILKSPSVKSFDYKSTDNASINLQYSGFDTFKYDDMIIFFESDFCKYLKNNNTLKDFSFNCEDYPGIIITVIKKNIK